jgi:GxxExxY protein
MRDVLFKEESYKIVGACFTVYNQMGCGFLESVYQECLEIEFKNNQIPFEVQKELQLFYNGEQLKQIFKPDFICYDKIILG